AFFLISSPLALASEEYLVSCTEVEASAPNEYAHLLRGIGTIQLSVSEAQVVVQVSNTLGHLISMRSTPISVWQSVGRAQFAGVRPALGLFMTGSLEEGFSIVYQWDFHDADVVSFPLSSCSRID